jgi:TolB-like protein
MMKCKLFLAVLLSVSTGVFAQNVSLDQAVQSSAQTIDTRLPKGAKTAVLTFTSASQAFSDYIIDEIATALSTSRNIQVIDRQHTAAIRKEFNIQFSGDVSDAEVKKVGQQLGAQYVVTGSLVDIGNAYRFRVAAINIETAVREGASSLNINIDDPQVVFLLTGRRPGQTVPVRRIAGNVPDFVRQAVATVVPYDALVGIGTAKQATLAQSRSMATTRARSEISRQMNAMVLDMVRDYTASSEVDPSTTVSFTENITTALSRSNLQGATIITENTDANGNYWVAVQLTKTNVVREFNQAVSAAKLAVPAMLSFDAEYRLDAALERACRAEIGYSDR